MADKSLYSKVKSNCDLILFDLDGTLLGASNHLLPHTLHALLSLRRRRLPHPPLFAICTGRPYGGVATQTSLDITHQDRDALHIYHGGALIRSARAIFHQDAMDTQTVLALIDQATASFPPSFALELYSPSTIFVQTPHPLAVRHADLLGMSHQVVDDLRDVAHHEAIIKAQWILPSGQLSWLRQHDLPHCTYANSIAEVMPDVAFVTVTAEQVDKGSAVRRLLRHLQIAPERTVAIGDSENDLPMLATVGFPFVMGNAAPKLRALYPNLPHIEHEGVTPLIEALL